MKGHFSYPDFWVEIAGVVITQPVTLLTNLLMGLLALYYWNLTRQSSSLVTKWFSGFFFCFGVSSIVSGIVGHGFIHYFPAEYKKIPWILGMAGSGLFSLASLKIGMETRIKNVFMVLVFLAFLISVVLLLINDQFAMVQYYSVLVMLGIAFPVFLFRFFSQREACFSWFLFGILLSAVASLIFTLKLTLSDWFNHVDLSHLFLCMVVVLYGRGAMTYSEYTKKNQAE